MIDLTKPLQTRNGLPVRLTGIDPSGPTPLQGVVIFGSGAENLTSWAIDGTANPWAEKSDQPDICDLVNAEPDMLDLTKPVQTRDGRPVRLLCTDANSRFPVTGLVSQPQGNDVVGTWTVEGSYLDEPGEDPLDLVNVSVRHEGWVNIRRFEDRPAGLCLETPRVYATRAEADAHAKPSRIACVFISFTEGEGL